MGFLFLKLPPPPCAVLLVTYIANTSSTSLYLLERFDLTPHNHLAKQIHARCCSFQTKVGHQLLCNHAFDGASCIGCGCCWRPLKYEIICHVSPPCGKDVKHITYFPTEDWEHMFSTFTWLGTLTSLQSPAFMVQDRLLPLLRASARKGGRPKIVNVASMAGRLRQLSPLRQVRQATSHIWNMRSWNTKNVLETDVG